MNQFGFVNSRKCENLINDENSVKCENLNKSKNITKVANLKKGSGPVGGIKYKTVKEWDCDSDNIYVGREMRINVGTKTKPETHLLKQSKFHNPFKFPRDGSTIKQVLEKYENHLDKMIESEKINDSDFVELRGKTLGCWCTNNYKDTKKCHAAILASRVNEYWKNKNTNIEELNEVKTVTEN